MFPTFSFSIDSLWKVLTLVGGLLFGVGILYPVSVHRDFDVKAAAHDVESFHFTGELMALKEQKQRNLEFLHQHGVKMLLQLHDENGKLRTSLPTIPPEITEKLNEHEQREATYNKAVTTALEKEKEQDARAVQFAAEQESVSKIDNYCFWGKLVGAAMLLTGGLKWFRWEQKRDADKSGPIVLVPRRLSKIGIALAVSGAAAIALPYTVREFTGNLAELTRAEMKRLSSRMAGEMRATVPRKEPDSWLFARIESRGDKEKARDQEKFKAVAERMFTQYPHLQKHRKTLERMNLLDGRLEWQDNWVKVMDGLVVPAWWVGFPLLVVGVLLTSTNRFLVRKQAETNTANRPLPSQFPASHVPPTAPSETVIG